MTRNEPGTSSAVRIGATLLVLLVLGACGDLFTPKSEGEKLWRKYCAHCHGLDAAGNTPRYMGDSWADLTDDAWHTGGDEYSIREVVRSGVFAKMPGNDKLTDEQLDAVVRWLYHLRGETPDIDESGEIDDEYDDDASSGDDADDGELE